MRAVLALVLCFCIPAAARAQEAATEEDRAEAQAMLAAGIASAEDGDWEAARIAFTRAYALVTSTRVLMNLAGAQRHTGRLVDAAVSYRRWLIDATERDEGYRPTVETALAEIERDLPHVTVRAAGARPTDVVMLDGVVILTDERIDVDPGRHLVEVSRGDATLRSQRFELAAADDREIVLVMPADAGDPGQGGRVGPSLGEAPHDDIVSSPWLWVGVGAGAAVVIAVIIGVAVASSSSGGAASPDVGTLGPFAL